MPFALVFVAGVYNTMFTHVFFSKVLYRISLGNLGQVCHLQYGDLLILLSGGKVHLRVIKLILFLFEGMSGMPINFHKTCHFPIKFNSLLSQEDLQTLSCPPSALTITYVGVPIVGRRPRKLDLEKLIALVRAKLGILKAKFLSLGGRLAYLD